MLKNIINKYNIFPFLLKKKYIILLLLFSSVIKVDIFKANTKNIIKNIRIGVISSSMQNGGVEKQTSLLLNYFSKIDLFKLFLFNKEYPSKSEFLIDNNVKRIIIKNDLVYQIKRQKIEIAIYQNYDISEIKKLNKLKKVKTIVISHTCFLFWIYYGDYLQIKYLYNTFKETKYVISLIPFENDYLFKKWGIRSILMNNFIPYDFNSTIPSDLSSKTIVMIGRDDVKKRFYLGIEAMQYIVKYIPKCEMLIFSKLQENNYLRNLTNKLNLNKNIKFLGYYLFPEKFYNNISLHIFPSTSEAFPNVLSETLIYGIPTILLGLDYVSIAKGGTIILYDDSPLSIAKIATKILSDKSIIKKLGKEARKNIKKYKNELLLNKWVKLIQSIYKGDNYYEYLRNNDKKIDTSEAIKIIKNQIYLLQKREKKFQNITLNDIENFTYMENIK